ncbi:hypothetical protein GBA63_18250 [Rubrobacter tropicus]|uniref:Right handed beta helix domain-containing protein n=1 Tax=Rubrobacter tropicus TaxID=2653851 RepID=A0A6G8QCZ3_9ACTN|nr:right-handed parallel beta-helix repeat-containing protein [Rubrobacter tropicus]QIN84365.1 hypothetical protein GBA63_18250 [Rubrobacter tropicus]
MKRLLVLSATLATLFSAFAYVPQAEGATCTGKQVSPGQNLSSVAANARAGTTFCIKDGNYAVPTPVRVQNRDRFIGMFSDGTRPSVTTTKAQHVFDANGSRGATIRGLGMSGAVGGDHCKPNCGRGIGGGTNLTINNVWSHHNQNQGIGGTGPGLLVTYSRIDHNGSPAFARFGESQSAAGIKSVNSMTVLNSRVHDNYWSGVWCDNDCDAFQVRNNTITANGKAGIHYEASSGPAVFANNVIRGNGTNAAVAGRRAGLIIYASANAEVYGNAFGSNTYYGIHVAEDDRDWTPLLGNISIYNNTMGGDAIVGCTLSGVGCL